MTISAAAAQRQSLPSDHMSDRGLRPSAAALCDMNMELLLDFPHAVSQAGHLPAAQVAGCCSDLECPVRPVRGVPAEGALCGDTPGVSGILVGCVASSRIYVDHGPTGRRRDRPGVAGRAGGVPRRRHAGRDQARSSGPLGARRPRHRRGVDQPGGEEASIGSSVPANRRHDDLRTFKRSLHATKPGELGGVRPGADCRLSGAVRRARI